MCLAAAIKYLPKDILRKEGGVYNLRKEEFILLTVQRGGSHRCSWEEWEADTDSEPSRQNDECWGAACFLL